MPISNAIAHEVSTRPVTSERRRNGTRSAIHDVVAASKLTLESCTTTMATAKTTTPGAPAANSAPVVTSDSPTPMAVRAPLRSAARPTAGAARPANSPALRARPMTPTEVPSPLAITPRNGAG